VEHRDSTQSQCLSRTQKPQDQKGVVHSIKEKRDRRRERFVEGPRDAREGDLRFQSNIQSCRAYNVCEGAVKRWLCHSLLDFHPPIKTTQTTKFECTDTNFEIEAPISTWRLSVNYFKRMNNESYIRIVLSNLAALLALVNLLVLFNFWEMLIAVFIFTACLELLACLGVILSWLIEAFIAKLMLEVF
jgi:hypothetical protein